MNKNKNETKKLVETVERRHSERAEIREMKKRIEGLENRIKAMEGTGLIIGRTEKYNVKS